MFLLHDVAVQHRVGFRAMACGREACVGPTPWRRISDILYPCRSLCDQELGKLELAEKKSMFILSSSNAVTNFSISVSWYGLFAWLTGFWRTRRLTRCVLCEWPECAFGLCSCPYLHSLKLARCPVRSVIWSVFMFGLSNPSSDPFLCIWWARTGCWTESDRRPLYRLFCLMWQDASLCAVTRAIFVSLHLK